MQSCLSLHLILLITMEITVVDKWVRCGCGQGSATCPSSSDAFYEQIFQENSAVMLYLSLNKECNRL